MKDSFKELLKKGEIEPSQGFTERLMLKIEAEKTTSRYAQPRNPVILPILLVGAVLFGMAVFLFFTDQLQIANQAINLEAMKTPLFVLFAFFAFYAVHKLLVYRIFRG